MTSLQQVAQQFGANLLPDHKTHTNRMEIASSSSNNLYIVAQARNSGEWQCSCPGWIYKKAGKPRGCKHLTAMLPALMMISASSAPAEISAPALALAPEPKAPKAKAPKAPKPELVAAIETVATAVKSKAKTDREKVSDILDQFRAYTLAEVDADQHLNYSSLQDFMLRAMMQFDASQQKVKKSS